MAHLFAFSGACHSGKTTTMQAMEKELTSLGYTVHIVGENMRDVLAEKNMNIDELRSDPELYAKTQCDIVYKKMQQENAASDDMDPKAVYLIDRACTDSDCYISLYVDMAKLSNETREKIEKLKEDVAKHIFKMFFIGYSCVFEFYPIEKVSDTFVCGARPTENFEELQQMEYDAILYANACAYSSTDNSHVLCTNIYTRGEIDKVKILEKILLTIERNG